MRALLYGQKVADGQLGLVYGSRLVDLLSFLPIEHHPVRLYKVLGQRHHSGYSTLLLPKTLYDKHDQMLGFVVGIE